MKGLFLSILTILCATATAVACEGQDTTIVQQQELYHSKFSPKQGDKQPNEPSKSDPNYWRWAALHQKLNLKDTSVIYPAFVKLCVDVYNWGDNTFNSYDTTYVQGTGKKWKISLRNDNWNDSYMLHFPSSTTVRMVSQVSSNIGFSLSYMALSLGYMVDFDVIFGGKSLTHKKWDFQFSCSRFAIDAYASKNTGSTLLQRISNYNDDQWMNYPFNDINSENYGIDLYYFFNNRKYSQSAAYTYSKIQKRSAGSFITGLMIASQDISIDFSNLNNEMIAALPEIDNLSYHFRYYDFCALVGYGYNQVLGKHWLFNITALPSIGMKHCLVVSEEGESYKFSANIKAKTAFVYNCNNKLFVSFYGKFDLHWYSSQRYNFANVDSYFNFCAGWRF